MIQYIYDTLQWVPSKNPAMSELPIMSGINYHGVTLFDSNSTKSLLTVFTSWKDIFSMAPATFELKGPHNYSTDTYEQLQFNRYEIISQFEKIITMIARLKHNKHYLYHFGI